MLSNKTIPTKTFHPGWNRFKVTREDYIPRFLLVTSHIQNFFKSLMSFHHILVKVTSVQKRSNWAPIFLLVLHKQSVLKNKRSLTLLTSVTGAVDWPVSFNKYMALSGDYWHSFSRGPASSGGCCNGDVKSAHA